MTPISGLGKAMTVLGMLSFLVVLTLLFGGIERSRDFPNRDTTASLEGASTVVRLAANRQGHYLLPGAVNGVPVQFLVDTGATQVVIPAHLASRLALERGQPLKAKTAAGWITVYQTALSSIDLAGIELENIPASLNPAMQGDEILLGMSALTELELSIAQDTLTLRYRH